jgi:SAM-dependent methyltransferase
VHYRSIADDIRAYVPHDSAVVLDYGCGEALHAEHLASACGLLVLCDAASGVRAGLSARFAHNPRIAVKSPEEIANLPSESLDLISIVSVAQYLSPVEFASLLALFRRVLKPSGCLLVADIIPPSVSPLTDALALLRFAKTHGFLLAAIRGLARTALSDYRKLRSRLGLTHYSEQQMMQTLGAASFAARLEPRNVGHNPARMTFVARRG